MLLDPASTDIHNWTSNAFLCSPTTITEIRLYFELGFELVQTDQCAEQLKVVISDA